ncbi:MAG: hypothetical protein IPK97_15005 [Ahniella sp.]|nr:hypothetical protein [Ahniella sp.]
MTQRLLPACLFALCLLLTSGFAGAYEWKAVVSPKDQIYPSLILATSDLPAPRSRSSRVLGDANGLIGVRVLAEHDQQRARVSIRLNGLLPESSIDVVLPQGGKRYSIYPVLAWDFDRLRKQKRATPETLSLTLRLGDGPIESMSQRVRIRSINEAPYFIADAKAPTDLTWTFAAYVDEDHPIVARIVSDALAQGTVNRFDGYQSGNAERVLRQVFAVWRSLQTRGIRYSSLTRTGSAETEVYSQYVRFLDESFASGEANCVDGSVLFASVLRKVDLNPSLVLLPGHMLLAFELSPGGDYAFLETTQIDLGHPRRQGPDHRSRFVCQFPQGGAARPGRVRQTCGLVPRPAQARIPDDRPQCGT